MGHIYRITNQINGKSYIGYSDKVEARWADHKHGKGSALVYQAIKKYGIENITFEILAEASEQEENAYIQKYNTMAPNGYNLTPGGGLPPNHKGKTYADIYGLDRAEQERDKRLKTKLKNGRLGGVRSHTEETKKRIQESVIQAHANRDCSHSEDTKQKISQANKGRLAGANNPKAKRWLLIDPNGTQHRVNGNLRQKCKELGLSFSTIHAAHYYGRIPTSGPAKGWQIKEC